MRENGGVRQIERLKDAAPLALSFVGDAVHTLMVRTEAFKENPYRNGELHGLSSAECCAKAQAAAAKRLVPLLNEDELFIYKKGKNAKVHSVPKNASLYDYKEATAFEAVIGYLYLAGETERLDYLMRAIYDKRETETTETED